MAEGGGEEEGGNNDRCVICLENPAENRVSLGCCRSDFCCDCLETWTASQNTCPHCRERVRRFKRPGGRPDCVLSADRDRAIPEEDEETRPDVLDPEHWISDAQVKCIGDSRCKWRSGEFDELSMSEQIELEGENCSIQCDQCTSWFHSFCVGFQSREALPSEDIDWLCPFCAGSLKLESSHSGSEQPARAAVQAPAERREAAAAAAERRAAGTADDVDNDSDEDPFAAFTLPAGSTNDAAAPAAAAAAAAEAPAAATASVKEKKKKQKKKKKKTPKKPNTKTEKKKKETAEEGE